MRRTNLFYSKIILFGEYGIIFNSKALSIPFASFYGELSFQNQYKYTNLEFAEKSNKYLKTYLRYLREMDCCLKELEIEKLEEDINKGMYFESSIPLGYGLGSSGALVAAIYTKYAKEPIPPGRKIHQDKILELKNIFAMMESYFHGKSSGIDPLISYIQFPLIFHGKEKVSTALIPRTKNANGDAIFLLDTKQVGRTEPLVHYFLEKYKEEEYRKRVNEQMIPLINHCIDSLVEGKHNGFFEYLTQLSDYQLRYLNPMIPYEYQSYWKKGLESQDYILKLCGSGGGGYLLGFTRNAQKMKSYFKERGENIIMVYQG